MMGYRIFLAVVFLIGIGVEANPMERCMEMVKFNEQFENIINMASEAQLNLFCVNMTSFLRCTNDVVKQQTGFTLKELAELLEDDDIGKALSIFVNIQELVDDICTEGTELHEAYLASADCYKDMPNNIAQECENQAQDAYSAYRELQVETGRRRTQVDEPCVVAAYQLGCLGADVKQQCGEVGYDTYKKVVKKIGFFKSGLCSSEILDTFKNDLLDRLELEEEQKILYRVILELKRRRR